MPHREIHAETFRPGIINRILGTDSRNKIVDEYIMDIAAGRYSPPPNEFGKSINGTKFGGWELSIDFMAGVYYWNKYNDMFELQIAATPFWEGLNHIPVVISFVESNMVFYPLEDGDIHMKAEPTQTQLGHFSPNVYLDIMRPILNSI